MNTKKSADYQREYRKRLRESGLVKKDVWIRPENTKVLVGVEKQLRQSFKDEGDAEMLAAVASDLKRWSTAELYEALKQTELFVSGLASIEIIEGVEPSLYITMYEFGDLPVFLTVAGEQIIAESILWSVDDVKDRLEFDELVLRTHKYFPLSTVSLDKLSDGLDYYMMFGALSASSILPNVILELEILASNVIQATEAYSEHLRIDIAI